MAGYPAREVLNLKRGGDETGGQELQYRVGTVQRPR